MNKKKFGLKASLLLLGAILLALVGNIALEKYPLQLDMTENKLYEISDQTKQIIQGVDQEVTIYVLNTRDGFAMNYRQTVEAYESMNSKVQVLYRDRITYPGFVAEYDPEIDATTNSLLVVSGERYIYLDQDEYYQEYVDEADGMNVSYSYELEGLLTNAVATVTGEEAGVLYQTAGHQEYELSNSLQGLIKRENYKLETLTFSVNTTIPEDATLVLINSPLDDFSESECEILASYIKNGGNLCYIPDPTVNLPNLQGLVKQYGIDLVDGIVCEQNKNMLYVDDTGAAVPTYIIPTVEDNAVTAPLVEKHAPVFTPVSKGMTLTSKSGYEVFGLLATSSYAYSKVNADSEYISREDEDIVGPFYLAAMAKSDKDQGSVCVFGCPNMITEDVDSMVYSNNTNLLLNAWSYMSGENSKIAIRGKTVSYDMVMYGSNAVQTMGVLFVVLIPLGILIAGVVILVRRNRGSQKKNRIAEE